MTSPTMTPVFVVLRVGAHLLFFGLIALVVIREALAPGAQSGLVIGLSAVLLITYALGAVFARPGGPRFGRLGLWWIGALSLEWVILLWFSSEAAYLVFPLFFLYLHFFGRWWGPVAILAATAAAIFALGLHGGWSVGGVVGPLVGAGVALLIGLGTQELAREAAQREQLVRELIDTRSQLAATEHEAGVLAERARLAREIHDTLAQGLSSIGMLLHAAERADPERPGVEHLRLARETAAVNLTEARRFIRELTPPQLDDDGLGGALRRLAESRWAAQGLTVQVRVSDSVTLPMHVQTALLRIAQGAIANVIQHARASSATISLATDSETLSFVVTDDGDGFDPRALETWPPSTSDSFGLHATRERVRQLGGTLSVGSAPGHGTTLTVTLPGLGGAMIRIVIADDHPIVRAGLVALMSLEHDVCVVAEAATPDEAVAAAERENPDLVLMDLQFGGASGLGGASGAAGGDSASVSTGAAATRRIRALEAPPYVLVLTNYDSDADILGAVEAGASGYLLKDTPPHELIAAVRAAAAGQSALAPVIASRLLDRLRAPQVNLSSREIEVLRLVANGCSNTEVAHRLFLSETTVKSHLAHIYSKLDVSSRTAAVSAARRRGILR